jgi:hypothetical protein
MRQAGVLAAAALVGLADAEEVLLRDHSNAQRFAQGACSFQLGLGAAERDGGHAAGPRPPAGLPFSSLQDVEGGPRSTCLTRQCCTWYLTPGSAQQNLGLCRTWQCGLQLGSSSV